MDSKCNRCGVELPEVEKEDNICTKCAIKEWEKILNDDKETIPLTEKELEQLQHSSLILTQYHNSFAYGRVEEKKMAESL